MKHRYSPHPIESYFIPGADVCEFRQIAKSEHSVEIWNLLWLSLPSVDSLPGSSPKGYWRNFISVPDLLVAVIADAISDEKLRQMLSLSPAIFHSWWCAESDYTIYDTWHVAGPAWVEGVADRSDAAAVRGLTTLPIIYTEGRTLRINLPRAA